MVKIYILKQDPEINKLDKFINFKNKLLVFLQML